MDDADTSGGSGDGGAIDLPAGAPEPGLYRHYKGGLYRVLGLVRHSETLDVMVLYQALYGAHGCWVRPRAMFLESVPHGGAVVPRFARIADAPHPAVDDGAGLPGATTGAGPERQ